MCHVVACPYLGGGTAAEVDEVDTCSTVGRSATRLSVETKADISWDTATTVFLASISATSS